MSSTLDFMDGMAWDPNGKYLYFSRTVSGSGTSNELRRYNPATNTIANYSSLPGDTDAIDFGPGGLLYGAYRGGSGTVVVYTYDVNSKSVKGSHRISTPHRNFDAFAACVPG